MPDYKLKSGDIVFVASADVDSFLKNNEGATLVEAKVEVPKKTKDPVVVDQAAESKEVTMGPRSLNSLRVRISSSSGSSDFRAARR